MSSFFKKIKTTFIIALISLCTLVLVLVLAEVFVRFSTAQEVPESTRLFQSDATYFPRPYVMHVSQQQKGYNLLGYLGELPEKNKPGDEFRIFLLGSSCVQAGDPTIAFSLQNIFHDHGHQNVRVYNFGVGSSILREDVIRILNDLSPYKPDLIIHYSGANDFTQDFDPRINYPHRYFINELNPLNTVEAEHFGFINSMLLSSQLVRKYFQDFLTQRVVGDHIEKFKNKMPFTADFQEMKSQALAENILWGKILSENIGAKYIFILQPMVVFKDKLVDYEVEPNSMHVKKNYLPIYEKLLNKISQNNLKEIFVDYSDYFKNVDKPVFLDFMHFRDMNYNTEMAQAIYKTVLDKKVLNYRNKNTVEWHNDTDYMWWLEQKK